MYVLVNLCIIDNVSTPFLVVQIPLPVSGQTAPEKSGEAEAKTSVSFFYRFLVVLVCVVLLCVGYVDCTQPCSYQKKSLPTHQK